MADQSKYEENFERIFGKHEPKPGRRRYRWVEGEGFVEIQTTSFIPRDDLRFEGNFISPIDGTEIRSKQELHDHNRRHNVIQTTDGHMQDWDREEKRRERFFNGNPDGKAERVDAIKETLYKLGVE